MSRQFNSMDEKIKRRIYHYCSGIAGSTHITAACISGDYAVGLTNKKMVLEALVVLRDFQPRLKSYVKDFDSRNLIVFATDEWIFERDVDRGFLGEALAERVIFPYIAMANKRYLYRQEVRLKKRLILELLGNLVFNFPELSYNLHIEPEYFMYETMMTRARLFPPMTYHVSNFLRKDSRRDNVESVMHGYLEALNELEEEGAIRFSEGRVRICKDFVAKVESKKARFTNLFRSAQRTLFSSFLGAFSKTFVLLSQSRETFLKFQGDTAENSKLVHQLEDPYRYLYIPTSRGLVPLADRTDIEAFAGKVLSQNRKASVEISKLGGVLNDVYLVRVSEKNEEKKVVVKRFRDWSSFKWFPINLWTLGTRTFAVLGRSRLERECSINQELYSEGYDVSKILYVSHGERLVFMEYVEGERLDRIVKRIIHSQKDEDVKADLRTISRVAERFAEIHLLGIALGDTKPENVMVREENGEICLLDLEQASRRGDKSWDIAEFLYYAGHYIPPFVGTRQAETIAKAFVTGYLRAGGDIKLVRKAGHPKYTKVFSVFTLPHTMLAISNICRRTATY